MYFCTKIEQNLLRTRSSDIYQSNVAKTNECNGRDTAPVLSVLVPVFNEERTLCEILRHVFSQSVVKEVIAIDDFSTDRSRELLKQYAQNDPRLIVVEHIRNRGKGAAIRSGIPSVKGEYVVIQDADLEYNPMDFQSMLRVLQNNEADVVYGSRFAKESNNFNPKWHTIGNRCLTTLSNFASKLKLTDEATCYKMFRAEILKGIDLKEDGFGFCPEVTAKIGKMGVRITEVPISYKGRTRAQGKKIRLRDGFNALKCILKYNYFE